MSHSARVMEIGRILRIEIPRPGTHAYTVGLHIYQLGKGMTRDDVNAILFGGEMTERQQSVIQRLLNRGWLVEDGELLGLSQQARRFFDMSLADLVMPDPAKKVPGNLIDRIHRPSLDKKHHLKWPGMRDIRFKTIGG